MGIEYRIETDRPEHNDLREFLRRLPEFLCEEEESFHLGCSAENILFTVQFESDHIYVCQFVASKETNALLGLLIRRLLSFHEKVVITEP